MTATPAEQIIATLDACEAGLAHQSCPDQAAQEPQPEYATRVLGYALTFGIEPLSLEQLETADAQAARIVANLPAHFDDEPDARRLDATLHTLRLRLACRMGEKRRQRAALQRAMDELYASPPDDPTRQAGADMAELSDQERALTLLRAALVLIMGPQPPGSNGGGRPAPLVPPPPTRPPSGQAVDPRPPAPRRF